MKRFLPLTVRTAAVVLIGTLGVTVAACGQAQSSNQHTGSTTTTAPPLPGGYGLVAPDPSLSDRMVLSSTRIASGHPIDGYLLVDNHGTVPINLTHGCRPDFVVVLTSSSYTPQVAWTTGCSGLAFIIEPGTNRFPLQVMTTYLECRQRGPVTTEPKCLTSGPPPLPAGNYDAVLVGDGLALPKPQPISVILTTG